MIRKAKKEKNSEMYVNDVDSVSDVVLERVRAVRAGNAFMHLSSEYFQAVCHSPKSSHRIISFSDRSKTLQFRSSP